MSGSEPLEFTGERFTPECVREIWYEHMHRYAFATRFVRGRDVLDAACGEGYGSALLAAEARSVLGVDISEQAIAHAARRYGDRTNLRFERGDVACLALPERSVDVVVSFETLEHLQQQEALVAGFARTLRENGLLLISSPDKATYSDATGFRNEFHVRELYRDELLDLLRAHFPHVHLYGQRLLFQSSLWCLQGEAKGASAGTMRGGQQLVRGLDYPPVYYLALCSRQPLPADLPAIDLFGDREESVYAHYNHEIRKNMAAGGRIAELEAEVARLNAEIARLRQT